MADGVFQISFRPHAEALAEVRRELSRWLAAFVPSATVAEELILAADELCANAIEAASGGLIELDARCDGSAVHLAVSNAGHAADEVSRLGAEPQSGHELRERGRGLMIVRAFTDSLAVVNVDGRTVARAVRLLPG